MLFCVCLCVCVKENVRKKKSVGGNSMHTKKLYSKQTPLGDLMRKNYSYLFMVTNYSFIVIKILIKMKTKW